jgi:hypothetical protein
MPADLKPKHTRIILPKNQCVRAFAKRANLASRQASQRVRNK